MSEKTKAILLLSGFVLVGFSILILTGMVFSGGFYVKTFPVGSFQRVDDPNHEYYILVKSSVASFGFGSQVTGDLIVIKPEGASLSASSRIFQENLQVINLTWSYPDGTGKNWVLYSPCIGLGSGNLCASGDGNLKILDVVACNAPDASCDK